MERRPLALVCAFALAGSSACVPFVQHGPWVHEGISGGGDVAGTALNIPENSDLGGKGITVGIDFGARAGFVPVDSTKPAFAAGLQVPLWAILLAGDYDTPTDALQMLSLDTYVTGPQLAGNSSALGLTLSAHHAMPYVQIGSRKEDKRSWYTTQAVLLIPGADMYLWMPSITTVHPDSRPRATHFTVGGGIGRSGGEPIYLLSFGVVMEFFQANKRVR